MEESLDIKPLKDYKVTIQRKTSDDKKSSTVTNLYEMTTPEFLKWLIVKLDVDTASNRLKFRLFVLKEYLNDSRM